MFFAEKRIVWFILESWNYFVSLKIPCADDMGLRKDAGSPSDRALLRNMIGHIFLLGIFSIKFYKIKVND